MRTSKDYDFAGWVTKNDLLCTDGVVIRHGAFADCDKKQVPLVWDHERKDLSNILGHVVLEHRDKGTYGYGYFNNSEKALMAKELVQHEDITAMSIAANRIKRRNGRDVIHGNIYEVSLVIGGANPGAVIDSVIKHSDDPDGEDEETAIIYTNCILHSAEHPDDMDEEEADDLEHAEDEEDIEKNVKAAAKDLADALTEEQMQAIKQHIDGMGLTGDSAEELIQSMSDQQLEDLADFVLDLVSEEEEEEEVKQNVFNSSEQNDTLTHSDLLGIVLEDIEETGTLSNAFLKHKDEMLEHGITNIDELLTVETTTGAPGWIRPEEPSMVDKILSSVYSTPRKTVRGRWADITSKEARARGYIKGNEKFEEAFSTWNRETYPQTIYKKQSLDNDDINDITDFDVVNWLKSEMREMLRYEIARCIFIPDGRLATSPDKVKEDKIRPITTDKTEFVTYVYDVTAAKFLETALKNKASNYKGAKGLPSLYMDEQLLIDIQLLKAEDGRYLFGDILSREALASKLGVKEIVTPDFLTGTGTTVMVNLKDYELASPNKGKNEYHEAFDIDYNKHKYLNEGRMAGALNWPKSAIVFTTKSKTDFDSMNKGQ